MSDGLKGKLTSYGDPEFSLFLRKAFLHSAGIGEEALEKPIVGITNTHSDFNSCHGTVPELIERVKRGVLAAGGIPMVFPTISIHESFAYPTSMVLRNLLAMDTEELIRAQPMDSVVLVGGCDKTLPAQLMAAVSAGTPAIVLPVGPMSTGEFRGQRVGACTDCRSVWAKFRAGEISQQELDSINGQLAPTPGTCMVMGTASTMAIVTETLGFTLAGASTLPATHSQRKLLAEQTGTRATKLAVAGGPLPGDLITTESLRNAQTVVHAIGGSTNAIIHLVAIARRAGIQLPLEEFDQLGRRTPVLVDLKPVGDFYMQDLHAAGGLMRVIDHIRDHLDLGASTVSGETMGQRLEDALLDYDQSVVRSANDPLSDGGAIAVLGGNLAPRGAVIKHAVASPELLQHTGRAVIFDSIDDMIARIDLPDLDVSPTDVLVLRNAGPKGAPGMPEAGGIPIPKKLARQGVRDMVRISDARMSGSGFGTIVLHVAPEAAADGPIGKLREGDMVELDVSSRALNVHLDVAELQERKSVPPPANSAIPHDRGYMKLFVDQVLQADEGCDFDFLAPRVETEPAEGG